jgi:hypothetical protein
MDINQIIEQHALWIPMVKKVPAQIGCQRHKLEDWWNFDDNRIIEMDGKR